MWRAQLLGGLVLSHGDLVIDRFSSQQAALLLARLLLAPGKKWHRDELACQIWPELCADGVATKAARDRLRHTLSTLRVPLQAPLGFEPFDAEGEHVRLNAPVFDIDVDRFERHTLRRQWAAALDCWRGELLPGQNDDFIDSERERLLARREFALSQLDPDSAYDDDIEDHAGEVEPAPTAASRPITPYLTRFFGREDDIEKLCSAVAAHRVVTLHGIGGCGKTRLAMHAMQDMAGFDTKRFVALADCEHADLLIEHIRAAFNIQSSGRAAIEQLAARLAGQRVLLVLDNVEQLVGEELDAVLNTLLTRLPRAHLLLTSRRSLGRADETVIALASLPVPEAGGLEGSVESSLTNSPAMALFADRARAARGDFSLKAGNAKAVAEICRQLDGLPLAIELAAAQIRRHSPREMLHELQRSQKWLARPAYRAAREGRHGSLEAALDWSWRLLDEPARELLGHLCAFRGGWTEAQAQAVSDEAGALATLADASLVQRAVGHAGRLQMLHVVREFVNSRLAPVQRSRAQQRHRHLFGSLAKALDEAYDWPALVDVPNFVQAAMSACDDGEAAAAAELIQALDTHWRARGAPDELLALLPKLAADKSLSAVQRVNMLILQAVLRFEAGPSDAQAGEATEVSAVESMAALDQATQAAGSDPRLQAHVAFTQASMHWRAHRDGPRTLECLVQAETLLGETMPPLLRGRWLILRAAVMIEHEKDIDTAMGCCEQAERLLRSVGDRRTSLLALPGRTGCLLFGGRWHEAVTVSEAGAQAAAELGDVKTEVLLINRLANAHEQLKQYEAALDANRRELRLAHTQGLRYMAAFPLWNQPMLLVNLGQAENAVRLMAFAKTFWLRLITTLSEDDETWIREVRRLAEARLDAARCNALWAEGLAMDDHAAMSLALGRTRERGRQRS